jgi:hypothetical protein
MAELESESADVSVRESTSAAGPQALVGPGAGPEAFASAIGNRAMAALVARHALAARVPANDVRGELRRLCGSGAGNRAVAVLAARRTLARAAIDDVRGALHQAQTEGGGVGDFPAAFKIIVGLPVADQIGVLSQLADSFELDTLYGHLNEAPPEIRDQAVAAVGMGWLIKTEAKQVSQDDVDTIAKALSAIGDDVRDNLLKALIAAKRGSGMVDLTMEGLYLMMAAAKNAPTLNPSLAGVRGPVSPGTWAPPGNKPIPFYLGSEAHTAIAAEYVLLHPADVVRTNTIATSTILKLLAGPPFNLKPNLGALAKAELDGEPDILNLSRLHLYEIKPKGALAAAIAEGLDYQAAFVKAGIPVTFGPKGEPGTAGVVPAPDGVYIFESPQDGVILYEYKKMRLEEVTVPADEPEGKRSFRLAPLSPQQQAVVATATIATVMAAIAFVIWQTVGG